MPTIAVENYVKHIFLAQQGIGEGFVPMGLVARAMGVVPGTATTMIKSLAESELVDYEIRRGVRLTERGENLALNMLRRHRLIEYFLVEVLGMDWSEIHEDADRLEHALSAPVLEKLDAFLGYPTTDPHGDPIPSASGKIDDRVLSTLEDCSIGDEVKIARITDQDPPFLQFADNHGLKPGTVVRVEDRSEIADATILEMDGGKVLSLGLSAARKIKVTPSKSKSVSIRTGVSVHGKR